MPFLRALELEFNERRDRASAAPIFGHAHGCSSRSPASSSSCTIVYGSRSAGQSSMASQNLLKWRVTRLSLPKETQLPCHASSHGSSATVLRSLSAPIGGGTGPEPATSQLNRPGLDSSFCSPSTATNSPAFNDLCESRANRCHHHTVNIARRYFGGFGGRPCATFEFVRAQIDESQPRRVGKCRMTSTRNRSMQRGLNFGISGSTWPSFLNLITTY
jgi:hypothetical protein